MTTSPTRYLCGHPIWFDLRDVSSSSSTTDKDTSSDEILTKNNEKLTMKRIVDRMKRNHVEYAKLNVRTSPESIESVRFISPSYIKHPIISYTYTDTKHHRHREELREICGFGATRRDRDRKRGPEFDTDRERI